MDRPDPLSILIVDDSEDFRQRLHHLLESIDGIKIKGEAATAQEAIEIAAAHPFDIAILDIQMPGSGISVLKSLRKDHPSIRIVMLTNHADPFYFRVCMSAGAHVFLDKSLQFDELPAVLQALRAD